MINLDDVIYRQIARPIEIALDGGVTIDITNKRIGGVNPRSSAKIKIAKTNEEKMTINENLLRAELCAKKYRRSGQSKEVTEALSCLYKEYFICPEERMRNSSYYFEDDKDTLQMRIEATSCLERLLKEEKHLDIVLEKMKRFNFVKISMERMMIYCSHSDRMEFNGTDCFISSLLETEKCGTSFDWDEYYSETKNFIEKFYINPDLKSQNDHVTLLKNYIQFLPVVVVMRDKSLNETAKIKDLLILRDKKHREVLSALYSVMLDLVLEDDCCFTQEVILKFEKKHREYVFLMLRLICLMRSYNSAFYIPNYGNLWDDKYMSKIQRYPRNHDLDKLFKILFTETEIKGYGCRKDSTQQLSGKPMSTLELSPKAPADSSSIEDAEQDAINIKDICEMFKDIRNPKTCQEHFSTMDFYLSHNKVWQKHRLAIRDIVDERLKDEHNNTAKGVHIEGGTYVEQQYINEAKKSK